MEKLYTYNYSPEKQSLSIYFSFKNIKPALHSTTLSLILLSQVHAIRNNLWLGIEIGSLYNVGTSSLVSSFVQLWRNAANDKSFLTLPELFDATVMTTLV